MTTRTMGRMAVAAERSDTRHAWQRWAVVWHLVFAALLLLGVIAALRDPAVTPAPVLGLSAALAIWYAWWNVLRRPRTGAGQAGAHLGAWLLWFALIWLHVAFVPVGAFLAAHVCYLSLAWAVPVAAAFVGGVVARGLLVDDGVTAGLVLPLVLGAVVGVVAAGYIAAIARESAARADLIAELAAARGDAARSERRRGVAEERQRLARDVHDTLAQAFTSIIVQLGAARVATDAQARHAHVERAHAAARDGLAQARRVVWNLGDADADSLEDGLAVLAAGLSRAGRTQVTSAVTGTPLPVPPSVRRELLHIAREALTNADRHAAAARASVTLSYLENAVSVDICDDGYGMDPTAVNGGYGLRAMRERAEAVGGSLTIDTDPGQGTTVAATVPLA